MRRIFVPLQGPDQAGMLLDFAAQLVTPSSGRIDVAYIPDLPMQHSSLHGVPDEALAPDVENFAREVRFEAANPGAYGSDAPAFEMPVFDMPVSGLPVPETSVPSALPGGEATPGPDRSEAVRARIEAWRAAGPGSMAARTSFSVLDDGVVYASAAFGRACDLIVTRSGARLAGTMVAGGTTTADATPPGRGTRSFRDALLAAGRLTLLAPPGEAPRGGLLDEVVVAWDGSVGAAHALSQSLAVIERARSVRVLVVGSHTLGEAARDAVASYVALYNPTASIVVQDNAYRHTGRVLLEALHRMPASLVVMGVSGRSHQAGTPAILGGTLLKVIENARIPVLLAS